MGRHLNCGGGFGAGRRCFGELSKKQDDETDGERPFSDFISRGIFAVFCHLSLHRLLMHRLLAAAFCLLRNPPAMRRKANLPDRTCADMRRRELVAQAVFDVVVDDEAKFLLRETRFGDSLAASRAELRCASTFSASPARYATSSRLSSLGRSCMKKNNERATAPTAASAAIAKIVFFIDVSSLYIIRFQVSPPLRT